MVATKFLEHAENRAKERQRLSGGDKKSLEVKSVKEILPEPIKQQQSTDEVAG